MTEIKLSRRLRAAADFVREGALAADVGTDHAYLPIALCLEGRIRSAIASDVNEGPIMRAREHVAAYGLREQITTLLCDGLSALEPYAPTDILVLGMGGELIVQILSGAPWLCREGIRLILQPMTHPEAVRRYLADGGFAIVEECLVEEGKIYQIIVAEYTGKPYELSQLALLVGEQNLLRGDALTRATCERFARVFAERKRGKATVGADTAEEDQMLTRLEEYLS